MDDKDKKIMGGLGIGGLILIFIAIVAIIGFVWIMDFI